MIDYNWRRQVLVWTQRSSKTWLWARAVTPVRLKYLPIGNTPVIPVVWPLRMETEIKGRSWLHYGDKHLGKWSIIIDILNSEETLKHMLGYRSRWLFCGSDLHLGPEPCRLRKLLRELRCSILSYGDIPSHGQSFQNSNLKSFHTS